MIKKITTVLLFLFFTLSYPLSTIYAHVLKTDGSIGAVLHIDPDDDPIALSQSGFFFEFKDKTNRFSPQNCDCTFTILEGGKEIYSQPLFQTNPNPSLQSASVFYTFPQRDVYQVKVVGKPTPADAFQPFTLTYDVRVAREAANPSSQPQNNNQPWLSTHLVHLLGAGIVTLFVIIGLIKQLLTKVKGRGA